MPMFISNTVRYLQFSQMSSYSYWSSSMISLVQKKSSKRHQGNNKVHLLIQLTIKQMGLNIQNIYCPSSLIHVTLPIKRWGQPSLSLGWCCVQLWTQQSHTLPGPDQAFQPVRSGCGKPGSLLGGRPCREALECTEVTWGGPRTQTREKGFLAFSSPAHCQVNAASWEICWWPAELPKQTGKVWEITHSHCFKILNLGS